MRLKSEFKNQIEIERSKFITYLNKVFTEEEARAYISQIRKMHSDATHVCTAFIIGENNEISRSSDDGEPSGTAGVPMLESLKKSGLSNVVACVVRYYGGIKLGAGGLIRAYSNSVSEAIKLAPKVQTVLMYKYSLTIPYTLLGKIDYLLKDVYKKDIEYNEDVVIEYYVEDNSTEDKISELTSGQHLPTLISEEIIEKELD